MRNQLVILSVSLIFFSCDQVPTTIDETPYTGETSALEAFVRIAEFEYDFLSREFFISVESGGFPGQPNILGQLKVDSTVKADLVFKDDGLNGDIQAADNFFNLNWQPDDSLDPAIDTLWTLSVTASFSDQTESASQSYLIVIPVAPEITAVHHKDSLAVDSTEFVFDTLEVTVSHPQGLDEIRDVSMMSLKPDGSWANNGQPIQLYDDGNKTIFYSFGGIDFSSGDKIAGDGIYSLMLPLTPLVYGGTSPGNYQWTFTARSWLGIQSEVWLDTFTVLSAQTTTATWSNADLKGGVFR